MPKVTYTMSMTHDGGADRVVARGVSAARALMIALEHGGAGRTTVAGHSGPFHRYWELLRFPPSAGPDPLGNVPSEAAKKIMSALTPRSPDYAADAEHAYAEYGDRFLSAPGRYWAGRIETDADFARRRSGGEG